MVIIGSRARGESAVYVLFEQPVTPEIAADLGFRLDASSAFLYKNDFDPKLPARSAGMVCIATSDGKGNEPTFKKLLAAVIDRVLPALVAHFERTTGEDASPWLLTRIVAAVIARTVDERTFDAFAKTIAASLDRGDATSTKQNLTAYRNLLHYARQTDAAMAERVRANYPDLDKRATR